MFRLFTIVIIVIASVLGIWIYVTPKKDLNDTKKKMVKIFHSFTVYGTVNEPIKAQLRQ
jgi:predicted membrane channel-forming protein YqfA (hemolysin III family)